MGPKRVVTFLCILCALPAFSGCVELLAAGTMTGAAELFRYSRGNTACKTFTRPLPQVAEASEEALRRMQIPLQKKEDAERTIIIRAAAGKLLVELELEAVTPGTTRVSATAAKSRFSRDRATAEEIIAQVREALSEKNIPVSGAPPEAVAQKVKVYHVRPGDSPYRIARSHNMPLERFLTLNRLSPHSVIHPGQEVVVE